MLIGWTALAVLEAQGGIEDYVAMAVCNAPACLCRVQGLRFNGQSVPARRLAQPVVSFLPEVSQAKTLPRTSA
jgi:hypothetical protein